jgi:hypothetical protein
MRLICPSCHAEHALEALLVREAEARAVVQLLERGLPFGALAMRYIALFRPAKRRLGLERMAALVEELLPDLQRGAIARKGRDWPMSDERWRAGLEAVLAARDKGTLTLPLTSHGYLYEVLCALADKAEARAEAETEADRRNRRTAGAQAPMPAAAGAVLAAGDAEAPPPREPRAPQGPSRAALAIQAHIKAAQEARARALQGPDAGAQGEGTP